MKINVGELTVIKKEDIHDQVIKTLEKVGFTVILMDDEYGKAHYNIAKDDEDELMEE